MPLLLRTVSEPVTGTVAGAAETPGFVTAVSAALIGRPELLELALSDSASSTPIGIVACEGRPAGSLATPPLELASATHGSGMTGREGNMSEIRVLVVDDHDLFRTGLVSVLGGQPDIEVVAQASGGRMGVQLANELAPDVVLLDLRMPDLEGPEAARAILAERPGTKVLALTVLSKDDDVADAMQAGVSGFLAKDTPVDEIFAAVRAAAGGSPWLSPRAAEVLLGDLRQAKESVAEPPVEQLSPRELAVLRLVARGMENAEIAKTLKISPRTAKNHIASILRKLDPRWRGPGDEPGGPSGVREPRRPLPQTGGGCAQLQPPTQ
jgi:NarL family two-component system response regulator LiaR